MADSALRFKSRIKFHRRFGRAVVMLAVEDVGDMYGALGSKGRTWHLTIYRDPRVRRRAS